MLNRRFVYLPYELYLGSVYQTTSSTSSTPRASNRLEYPKTLKFKFAGARSERYALSRSEIYSPILVSICPASGTPIVSLNLREIGILVPPPLLLSALVLGTFLLKAPSDADWIRGEPLRGKPVY